MDASRCSRCGYLCTDPLINALDLSVAPGTRHHALLNSNEPPEDSDVTVVNAVLSDTDAHLAYIGDEILKIQGLKKLKQLEAEHASLSNYRARNRAILSAHRRMPPELLGEIFSWTMPSVTEILKQDAADLTDSPWMLTRISSHWRAISLLTPSLWSRVFVDSDNLCPVPMIEAQIQRARNLKIHFYGSETAKPQPEVQIFQLLSQHSSRWEELCVLLLMTSPIVPLLTALRDRLSSLERVWIQWYDEESQPAIQSIDCFQSAPSLVDFATSSGFRFVTISLPIHQLTRLHLDDTWEIHRGILKLAPNLVEAHIGITPDNEGWPDVHWPDVHNFVDLLHLRRLYISHAEALDYFNTPALEGCGLEVGPDESVDDIQRHLDSFIGRSACPLRKLGLRGSPDAHMTTQLLGKFPFITELVIENVNSEEATNELMEALTVSGGAVIGSHLTAMVFEFDPKHDIDYAGYLRMVKSRWQAADCAFSTAGLFVWPDYRPDDTTLRGLHTLRSEGLDLLLLEAPRDLNALFYTTSWML
ncbi:hypothetical protein K438DRAFT_102668 [Mycena galopus ATCC 62051]|nr:hypothetical protein K438DRAFT_102668 [Mycena galopus ATCC 62051]